VLGVHDPAPPEEDRGLAALATHGLGIVALRQDGWTCAVTRIVGYSAER
jgi:hypothetical protein